MNILQEYVEAIKLDEGTNKMTVKIVVEITGDTIKVISVETIKIE